MTRRKPDERDYTISALQAALDLAHARIRELELTVEAMAERMSAAVARGDHYELVAAEARERAEHQRRLAAHANFITTADI